ncbi:hypothetical protein [Cyanobium sp. NS01]|uniref:hypothetical protein n=1 Tax=Cyanobium sp. NS01 TaxID=261284 RepID=UPI001647C5ED|nr:hypothetical protein [Cyanobium sp. NS01]QNI70544.1 hypothetical protein CyaNS01_01412 [Cyanobium sp. NS01]
MAHASPPLAPVCALAAALAAAVATALAGAAPALAGSATASSIWNRENALQRAREQMPAGATETRERCEEIEVGMNNVRYRCTVWFDPAAPSPSGDGAQEATP